MCSLNRSRKTEGKQLNLFRHHVDEYLAPGDHAYDPSPIELYKALRVISDNTATRSH